MEPSEKAISFLLENPDTADFFNQKFGDGLAERYLSQAKKVQEETPLTAGQVVKGAVSNLVPSTAKMVGDIVSAISSPLQTGKAVLDVAAGTLQNILPESIVQAVGEDKASRQAANQVAQMYVDKYGSIEGAKRAIATDPAGVMADISTVLTGGSMAAAKAPQISAKLSQAASMVDPLALAAKGVTAGAKTAGKVAENVLGVTTGVGTEPIRQAFKAGAEGGQRGQQFTQNMRGTADMMEVLDSAKQNLEQLRRDKGAAYRASMQSLKTDKTVLGFDNIDNAVKSAEGIGTYKGKVTNQEAFDKVQEAKALIDDWKNADPVEYHTPEGIDALKQSVGGILEGVKPYTAADKALKGIYNSIKSEIKTQAPTYEKTMRAYSESSDQIKEIERALSLGDKASADTAMRKLQSLMRNNVQTNYGQRLKLAQQLEAQGGQQMMPALAGQALSEWTPRGIQRAAALPSALMSSGMTLPIQSPRLAGEVAYGAGRATKGLLDIGQRIPEIDYPTMFNLLYQAEQTK